MANRIVLRKSPTPGAKPTAAQLVPGELAINTDSGALFTLLHDGTTVHTLVPPGGLAAPRVASLSWTSTITVNWTDVDLVRIRLQGPTTLVFTGAVDGQRMLLELTQDEVGNRSVALPLSVRHSSTIPPMLLSTTAEKMDRLGFVFHGPTGTYDLVAVAIGF